MHATPPPKPAIIQPAPRTPTLADVEIIANGQMYHIPVVGIPCASNALFVSRIVKTPSLRMTAVLSCDGPGAVIGVPDDATPAPAVKVK